MSIDVSGRRRRATVNQPASSPQEPSPVPTVLIVDDNPDQLGLLTAYFLRAGCGVSAGPTPSKALALPPDVDLDMRCGICGCRAWTAGS